MSTKASIYYNGESNVHIYIELLDDMVHIETAKAGVVVDVEIMPRKLWVSLFGNTDQVKK